MLENAKNPAKKSGKNIIIYGAEGSGKTTIASLFPKPIFIRTEDGTESIADKKDVFTLDVCKTFTEFKKQLGAVKEEKHDFKTLVIDSITSLNALIEQEMLSEYKEQTVAKCAGGYGNGYIELANRHKKAIDYIALITSSRKMNAVLICHSDIEKVSPPDTEAYTSYFIRVPKKSRDYYCEFADCIAYIDIRVAVNASGRGMASGERRMICYPTPAHQSKNRWGIDDAIEIEKDKNPLEKYL